MRERTVHKFNGLFDKELTTCVTQALMCLLRKNRICSTQWIRFAKVA